MYGLRRVERGLYEHESGALFVRTYAWEGPHHGNHTRWERARRDAHGDIDIPGLSVLHRTLRDAVAEFQGERTTDA